MAEPSPGMEVRPVAEKDGGGAENSKHGFIGQLHVMLSHLSLWQKASLAGVAAAIVIGIILLVSWSSRTQYELLFAGLAPEDAASIVDQLKQKKIPYKISMGGTRLDVERGKARDLRLSFVGQGLPTGGKTKGFELFDELKLGATDFVENINYRRALEGELARTIVRFKQVSQARVHLVIPKRSLYWEKEKEPTASVWLKLRGGAGLDREQVSAVVHLVAGAVEGLSPKNITIVDSLGEILTNSDRVPSAGLTRSQLALRRETEKMYERKIVSLLQPIVGQDKVRAKVSVSMDFREVKLEEENYDPTEQVLRSEQELNEESGKPNEVGGVPGTRSNVGQEPAAPKPKKEGSYIKRTQRTRNYEVGKTVRKTIEHPGEIKRVSAAVILDDKVVVKDKDGKRSYEYEPLPAVEIAKCTELVKKAIGFSKDRGDTVVVENLSFDRQAAEEEQLAAAQDQREAFWAKVVGAVRVPLLVIALILIFVLVIRPLMKGLVVRGETLAPAPALAAIGGDARAGAGAESLPGSEVEPEMSLEGKTVEQLEAELLAGEPRRGRASKRDVLLKRINHIIQREPDTALQLLRTLMQGHNKQ